MILCSIEDVKDLLSKYERPAAAAGSAGVAGPALVDQALQGDFQAIEMIQNNSELIDNAGHQTVGVLGAIAPEYCYSAIKDDETEEGFGKYAVMLAGAYAGGGLG